MRKSKKKKTDHHQVYGEIFKLISNQKQTNYKVTLWIQMVTRKQV